MNSAMSKVKPIPNLSFTGIDDESKTSDLISTTLWAADGGLAIEWGVLHYPEMEGVGRNPSFGKMMEFADRLPCAAHLCGSLIFQQLLDPRMRSSVLRYLNRFQRVQVNINARKREFSDQQVKDIYQILLEGLDGGLILQYHPDTSEVINTFMGELRDFRHASLSLARLTTATITILVDASRGRGIAPESWDFSAFADERYWGVIIGAAGGLNPDNFVTQMVAVEKALWDRDDLTGSRTFYYDMESGVQKDPSSQTGGIALSMVVEICRRYAARHLPQLQR